MSVIIRRLAQIIALLFMFGMVYAAPASAQATRTWVSGVGDDANPCSRTAPCKTFAGAISKTAAGGEIDCLDPGGFGTVTIVKSMTIDCTGTFGSVLASGVPGITINGAGIDVILRGLSISGNPPSSPGLVGVRVLQASTVLIDRVSIIGFASSSPNGYGVLVANGVGSTPTVTIRDSTISGALNGGVSVQPAASSPASLTIIDSTISSAGVVGVGFNTGTGGATLTGKIINSRITGTTPGSTGVVAKATTGAVNLLISGSTISDAALNGINANGATAVVRVTGSQLVNNGGKAVNSQNSGQIISYGDNTLAGNGTDGTFTSTAPHS